MKRQQEFEVDGIIFVREQGDEYGPHWKVVDSVAWEERQDGADEYGTVLNNGDCCLVFKPNICCDYPLIGAVLQSIATFINQQDERDTANHGLTTLGL